MMLKRIVFIFLSFILPCSFNYLLCQTVDYRGKITDKMTGKVLPFSSIEVFALEKGVLANDNGEFILSMPANSRKDTIECSFLGYKRKKLVLNDLSDTSINIIPLEKESYVLNEVSVRPKYMITKKLGVVVRKNKGNWHLGNPGDQHAILIKNPFNKKGFLKNVSFYITKNGFSKAPFRVRIYSYDTLNNKPGEDLLNTSLIVSYNKTKGWFTIDMSQYNIEFPEKGLFVAMEWILTSEDYYYYTTMTLGEAEKQDVRCYGQTIGLTSKAVEILYWRRYLGTDWYHMKRSNAMINAEIEFNSDLKI